MSNAEVHALDKYINAINEKNDFDLAWRWCGNDTTPYIEVYEEAEGHILTGATIDSAVNEVRDALSDWGLEDVD